MAGVEFLQFLNSGKAKTGRILGPVSTLTYIQNGVELQFKIAPEVLKKYRNLQPKQWSGPEAVWVKTGPPLTTQWTNRVKGPGTGADNPEPQNVLATPDLIAYYDAPGPNIFKYLPLKPSRLYVVQNFTGWIVGDRIGGGGTNERLCEVAGWYSIVDLVDANWADGGTPDWQRMNANRSGTGWADTSALPQF